MKTYKVIYAGEVRGQVEAENEEDAGFEALDKFEIDPYDPDLHLQEEEAA